MSQKIIYGVLTFLILSTALYINFHEDLRIRIDDDQTTFYVPHENYHWIWTVSGRETNSLFDGTTKLNRDVANIQVIYDIKEGESKITRITPYKRGPIIIDTYTFDSALDNVELFPVRHEVNVLNAVGYFYQYNVRDLTYDGPTFKLDGIQTSMYFGKKMKVEWWEGYRLGWIYKSGSMYVKSEKLTSDDITFDVRLFDPDSYLTLNGVANNRTYEFETTVNISTDYSYLTILDDTNRYINYSPGLTYDRTDFLYNGTVYVTDGIEGDVALNGSTPSNGNNPHSYRWSDDYSPGTNPSYSSDMAYSGDLSIKLPNVIMEIRIGANTFNGTATCFFYDPLHTASSALYDMGCRVRGNAQSLFVGISAVYNNTHYVVENPGDSSCVHPVARSKGWHNVTYIWVSHENVSAFIDGSYCNYVSFSGKFDEFDVNSRSTNSSPGYVDRIAVINSTSFPEKTKSSEIGNFDYLIDILRQPVPNINLSKNTTIQSKDDSEDSFAWAGGTFTNAENAADENWTSKATYPPTTSAYIFEFTKTPTDAFNASLTTKVRLRDETLHYWCRNGSKYVWLFNITNQAGVGGTNNSYNIPYDCLGGYTASGIKYLQLKINITAPGGIFAGELYETLIDWGINYTDDYDISLDNRTELSQLAFNVTGYATKDVVLYTDREKTSLPGILNGNYLTQTQFIYNNQNYSRYNLSFRSAESKIIYVNYSVEGNSSRIGNFNLTMTAFDLDGDNEFNYTEDMEYLNVSSATYTGTFTNVTNPFLSYLVTENFINNGTADRWEFDGTSSFASSGCRMANSCVRLACSGSSQCNDDYEVRNGDYYDISNITYFTIQSFGTASDGGELEFEFTDLEDNIRLAWLHSAPGGDCQVSGCTASLWSNATFQKVDDNTWNITSVCRIYKKGEGEGGCTTTSGTYDISSLSNPYYLRWRVPEVGTCGYSHGTCVAQAEFSRFNIKGPQLNRTNTTISGVEGSDGSPHTGNFTTSILRTTASNVVRAILEADALISDNTNVTYYLSNDNGATFEEIVLGESHLFSSSGNQLRARFYLKSSYNLSTPIITEFTISVIPSSIDDLEIDVGNDGVAEIGFNYELNSTTTPVYWTVNDSSINEYIFEDCHNRQHCAIPFTFTTQSGGVLQIEDLNLTQDVNPIDFNSTLYEDDSSISISSEFEGFNYLYLNDFKFDYHGNKNITIVAHDAGKTSSINRTISVVYSKFDLFFPPKIFYWELFPSTANQSGVQPYGQDSTQPIWRINSTAYHTHGIDIYAKYNESIDTCVTQMKFVGQNFSKSYNNQTLNISNLLTSNSKIIESINNTETANIWTYTQINCSENTNKFLIPYLCFNSLCSDCVKTSDWDSACEVYS